MTFKNLWYILNDIFSNIGLLNTFIIYQYNIEILKDANHEQSRSRHSKTFSVLSIEKTSCNKFYICTDTPPLPHHKTPQFHQDFYCSILSIYSVLWTNVYYFIFYHLECLTFIDVCFLRYTGLMVFSNILNDMLISTTIELFDRWNIFKQIFWLYFSPLFFCFDQMHILFKKVTCHFGLIKILGT